MDRAAWQKLDQRKRNAAMAAGFSLRETSRPETPTETSTGRDLVFPVAPARNFRTAAQLKALNAADTAKLNAAAQDEDSGAEIRQEILDAAESFASGNWRHFEVPSEARTVPNYRRDFFEKFRPAFQAMRLYGPQECTPNDPAPPTPAQPMTAADFVGLPAVAIEKMATNMERYQIEHRNQRAELKRAYRAGTPAEKTALFALYEKALKAFPKEFI
jgi:hypothetical protein